MTLFQESRIPAEKVVWRQKFTNDTTVSDADGTKVNNPTVDNGVTLNGSDQYIVYPFDPRLGHMTAGSIHLRVKLDDDSGKQEVCFSISDSTSRDTVFFISFDLRTTTETLTVRMDIDGTEYWKIQVKNFLQAYVGEIVDIDIVHDGTEATIYFNGTDVTAFEASIDRAKWFRDMALASTPPDAITVGVLNWDNNPVLEWDGDIYDVTIYNDQKTASEIADINSNSTFNGLQTNDFLLWLELKETNTDGGVETTPNKGTADNTFYWSHDGQTASRKPDLFSDLGRGTYGAYFDGVNDTILAPDDTNFNFDKDDDFTGIVMIKPYDILSRQVIFGRRGATGWLMQINNGKAYFYLDRGAAETSEAGSIPLLRGQWNQIAWVHDASGGTGRSVYVNGELDSTEGSVVADSFANATEDLWIGHRDYVADLTADLAFLRIANKKLTATQIRYFYHRDLQYLE